MTIPELADEIKQMRRRLDESADKPKQLAEDASKLLELFQADDLCLETVIEYVVPKAGMGWQFGEDAVAAIFVSPNNDPRVARTIGMFSDGFLVMPYNDQDRRIPWLDAPGWLAGVLLEYVHYD